MADPLSVAASIGGLIQLTDTVFRRLFKYIQAVKHAPKEISDLCAEVRALYGILHSLKLVALQLEGGDSNTAIQTTYVESCLITLEKAKATLDKNHTPARNLVMAKTARLLSPIAVSDAKKLVTDIERHKTALGLALTVDSMSGLRQALSNQDSIQNSLTEIQGELQQRRQVEKCIALSKERRSILDWISISTFDPSQKQKMSLTLRHPGTGLWLTQCNEFKEWLVTPNSNLWLYGIPGAGKTVLASYMIQEALIQDNEASAVAYFYCDYGNPNTQDPKNILGSVARQIALKDERSFEKLETFYREHHPSDKPPIDYETKDLSLLVTDMASNFESASIIVDALDECGANIKIVTQALTGLKSATGNIKHLFFSRDEHDIRKILKGYSKTSVTARSSDLQLYVNAEIERRIGDGDLRIRDQALKDHIVEQLVGGADGMFRWVACQIDYLCSLTTDAARRRALKKLPPTLNATYERILRSVNQSSEDVQNLVQRSLRFICHSRRALGAEELCEAISIEPGQVYFDRDAVPLEEEILRCCSSLIHSSASGTMELAHFTVKEFLVGLEHRQDTEFSAYRITQRSDDIQIVTVCLTYLLFGDFAKEPVDLSEDDLRARSKRYAFRSYAVDYWASHVRENPLDPSTYGLVQRLLDPSKPNVFISWAQEFGLNVVSKIKSTTDHSPTWENVASPLHYAAMLALPEICENLVATGSDVNQSSTFGSALHCALLKTATFCGPELGNGDAINCLQEHIFEYTCMHDWPQNHTQSTIRVLLRTGADPNCRYHLEGEDPTPLELAVHMRTQSACRDLVQNGASLDGATANAFYIWIEDTKKGKSPIDEAGLPLKAEETQNNNATSMLQLALASETSASFNTNNADEGRFANPVDSFVRAAEHGQISVMERLLEICNIDINAKSFLSDGETAIHKAAYWNHADTIKFLLDRGAKLDVTDDAGYTPLHLHLFTKQGSCLSMLVEENSCSRQTSYGSTALHIAVEHGSIESVQYLMELGCDPCAVKHDGSTTLHCAIYRDTDVSKVRIVDLLLKAQVDPLQMRSDGLAPLHVLSGMGSQQSIRDSSLEILRRSADNALVLEQPDAKGMTALHHVCNSLDNNHSWTFDALKVLLSSNLDMRRHDLISRTALRLLVDR